MGEQAGHAFRGNQYTGGIAGGGVSRGDYLRRQEALDRMHEAAIKENAAPVAVKRTTIPSAPGRDASKEAHLAYIRDAKAFIKENFGHDFTWHSEGVGALNPLYRETRLVNSLMNQLADYRENGTALPENMKIHVVHGAKPIDVNGQLDRPLLVGVAWQQGELKPAFADGITVINKRTGETTVAFNRNSMLIAGRGIAHSHAQGWLSTADPEHLPMHELAHASVAATQFNNYGRLLDWNSVPGMSEKAFDFAGQERYRRGNVETANKVSTYATKNPHEFLAETFAGLSSGKTYPPDVMRLYEQLRGPKPLRVRRGKG